MATPLTRIDPVPRGLGIDPARLGALPGALGRYFPNDVEVAHLGRYLFVAGLAGACALLWAWARIDLRETAVALDQAQRELAAARQDNERLHLELASLRDPARLATVGLALDATVPVVTVPAVESAMETHAIEVAVR